MNEAIAVLVGGLIGIISGLAMFLTVLIETKLGHSRPIIHRVNKWIRRPLPVLLLIYGSWLQVYSHGDIAMFIVGSVLVFIAFGAMLGVRWERKAR